MDKKKQRKEQLDDAIENATKLAEIQELQKEVARIHVENEEARNQLKRAIADYQNLEKRVSEGRSELTKWGTAELLVKILPTLDHLEQVVDGSRSILSERSESKGWFQGVELAVKELQSILQSEGLNQIATEGQFDPNLHEALDTQEPSDAEAMAGKGENSILKVVRKGYNLNGKVLRPAGVVVGRKSELSIENQELSEKGSN